MAEYKTLHDVADLDLDGASTCGWVRSTSSSTKTPSGTAGALSAKAALFIPAAVDKVSKVSARSLRVCFLDVVSNFAVECDRKWFPPNPKLFVVIAPYSTD